MLIDIVLLGAGAAYWRRRRAHHSRKLAALSAARARKATPPRPRVSAASAAPGADTESGLSLKRLARDLKGAMGNEGGQALKLDLAPEERAMLEKYRRESTRNMLLGAGATGLAVLGNAQPLFRVLGAGAVLYLSRDLFHLVAKDFRRGHYLSMYLVSTIALGGMMLTGQLVPAALVGVVGGFFSRIIQRVEDDSEQALVRVFGGHPERVWVLQNEVEIEVDFHAIRPGDLVVVNAGEVVPVDGEIRSGVGQIDRHLLTGESQPVECTVGERVFASTLLLSGRLVVRVQTAGKDTTAARIGQVLDDTQGYKYTLISRGRAIADRWLPVTAGLSALTLPLLGSKAAIAVLWSNLGGPMGALGSLSVLSYLQILSRRHILVKDGRIFESLRQVDTVVFDKTGTLTLEQPTVARIHAFGDHSETTVLAAAAAAEYRQPHPIARAILAKAEALSIALPDLDTAVYEVGYGIRVQLDGALVRVGSARFLAREGIAFPEAVEAIRAEADAASHSLIYVGIDERLAGIVELMPTVRPEAQAIVSFLKRRGIQVYILSGDHEGPTRRMAETLGVDRYFAETLPEHKADRVKALRGEGRFVCFVGDGINDAIALQSAQVSISLKGASTVATDTAQIVFMDGTLARLPELFAFADEYEKTMKTNLVVSFAPGAIILGGVYLLRIGVGAAMGIFYLGCLVGLGNSLLPLARHQERLSAPGQADPHGAGASEGTRA